MSKIQKSFRISKKERDFHIPDFENPSPLVLKKKKVSFVFKNKPNKKSLSRYLLPRPKETKKKKEQTKPLE